MLGTATIADIAAAGVGFFIDTTLAPNAKARLACERAAYTLWEALCPNVQRLIIDNTDGPASLAPLIGFESASEGIPIASALTKNIRKNTMKPFKIGMVTRLNELAHREGRSLPWSKIWLQTRNRNALRQAGDVQWYLLHGALYSGSRLAKIDANNPALVECAFCHADETIEHLFMSCPRVEQFWTHLLHDWKEMIGDNRPPAQLLWIDVACGFPIPWCKTQSVNNCWPVIYLAAIWAIWTTRNGVRFGGEHQQHSTVAGQFDRLLSLDLQRLHQQSKLTRNTTKFLRMWSALPGLCIIKKNQLVVKYSIYQKHYTTDDSDN
jgi:hypothetical protein